MKSSSNLQIQLIQPALAIPLRHKVLRPNGRVEDCHYPQDLLTTTFHVGAMFEGDIFGVATFHHEAFPDLKAQLPYRLRGMATHAKFRGQGVGRLVLNRGLEELRKRKCDLLWFNARQVAFPFYEKMGFLYQSSMFEIPSIGPHKVMYNYLIK